MIRGSDGVVLDAGLLGADGGGAARIRINTGAPCGFSATFDAGVTSISPSLDSGCASTGLLRY